MARLGPKDIDQLVLLCDFYRGQSLNRSAQVKAISDLLPTIKDSRSKKLAVADIEQLKSEIRRFEDQALEMDRIVHLYRKPGRRNV